MAKLPRPRLPLPGLDPSDTTIIGPGTTIWRVYRTAGRHPSSWGSFRAFGPVAVGRFDHLLPPPHEDPVRAILYGALSGAAAVVEAFQDSRVIDRFRDGPWLVGFELDRDLVALDLRGSWPTRAGASQAIAAGRRDVARLWSQGIYAAYPTVQALLYGSAMVGGATNVAMYERSATALPRRPILHVPLAHPGLEVDLNRIAARYGYGLT